MWTLINQIKCRTDQNLVIQTFLKLHLPIWRRLCDFVFDPMNIHENAASKIVLHCLSFVRMSDGAIATKRKRNTARLISIAI